MKSDEYDLSELSISIQLTTVLDYPVDVNIFEKSGVQCRTGQVISMFAHCERINIIISHKSVTESQSHRHAPVHYLYDHRSTTVNPYFTAQLHVHTLDIARPFINLHFFTSIVILFHFVVPISRLIEHHLR